MNDLIRRSITGAGIVIFLLAGFLLHPVSFYLTGLILISAAMFEYYRIISSTGIKPMVYPGIITGLVLYTISTFVASGMLKSEFLLFLIPLSTLLIITEIYRKQERPFDSIAHTVFPLLWIAFPISLFPFTAYNQEGLSSIIVQRGVIFSPEVVFAFFLLTWSSDTGAYVAGITLGKHRLIERISPKKSWEGFFGGMILSAIVAFLVSGMFNQFSRFEWIIVSLIISVAGTYGDLAESMLKRSTGIKDSGSIMPGHGGFLDRFDSTILSFPLVYLFLVLFGG
ncbi:MAG TPA: phosphatidate cytidylyltransferase [Bacteroidales bacterium]|nr:phosphatidate cytidylyltransferase [Bacteroidales bacterium]